MLPLMSLISGFFVELKREPTDILALMGTQLRATASSMSFSLHSIIRSRTNSLV